METFLGYRRPRGLPGVRNLVAVIPSVFCANTVARHISEQVAGTASFCHPVGCSQVGLDLELTVRALKGLGRHPNFYGVVVVGLGCERFRARELAESIGKAGKRVELVVIQEEGDTQKAIDKGVRLASQMVQEAARQPREEFPLSQLCLGLKCGGTDATSGLAANPSLGWVADRIVEAGVRPSLPKLPNYLARRISWHDGPLTPRQPKRFWTPSAGWKKDCRPPRAPANFSTARP